MKYLYVILFFLLVSCGLKTPENLGVQEVLFSSPEEAVSLYPKLLIKNLGGGKLSEKPVQKYIVEGNLLNNDIALAILVTVVDPGGAGGNGSDDFLAVFTKSEGKYHLRDRRRVGGRLYRSSELISVESGSVMLNVVFYKEHDASCCPTVKATTSYELHFYPSVSLEEGATRIMEIVAPTCNEVKSEINERNSEKSVPN